MKFIVVSKVVYNNSKKVIDIVIYLLSIKGDSNFALYTSDRFDDFLIILRKFVYYLFIYSVIG